MKFLLKTIALITFALIFGNSFANSQDWTKLNGVNKYINNIYCPTSDPSMIVVASDTVLTSVIDYEIFFLPISGTGYQVSNDKGSSFGTPILNGYSVYSIIKHPITANTWIAAVRQLGGRGGILISSDNGANWTNKLKCDGVNQILDIKAKSSKTPSFIMAAANSCSGLIYTNDDYLTCNINNTANISSRSIAISKLDTNLMFAAGDTKCNNGVFRSTDNGITWVQCNNGIEGLRILSVCTSSKFPNYVFCGADTLTKTYESMGKGIYYSTDTGNTWKLVGAKGHRVTQIAEHPKDPRFLVAACDSGGVWFSGAYGSYWEPNNIGLPDNYSVRTVAVPNWDISSDGFVALAGVTGEGLYKSRYITTSVNLTDNQLFNNFEIKSIYPQPFNNVINIDLISNSDTYVYYTLIDMLGNICYSNSMTCYKGINQIRINLEKNLSQGVYMITIKSGANIITKNIVRVNN